MTPLSVLVLVCTASAAPQAASERVREPRGAVLLIEDGRLFRERRGGARTAIGCTSDSDPGRVLDLALDPAGLVFVAAERGLFLLGPFVDVLDPVELLEGAPQGAPTSVFVDPRRRVWVATADEVGVLDPSFFWGRTLMDLAGPGPYRVSGAPDGDVVIANATASWRYQRSAGEAAPRIARVIVDGHETSSGTKISRPAGAGLELDVAGDARGGATFRYRLDHHHVWRNLVPPATLALPSPGAHTLEIVALDQVLERSAPWTLHVDVAYPLHFDGRFVVGAVALGALLVLAAFLIGSRGGGGAVRPWRALVSTGLLVTLVLQALAGFEPHAKGWPFVGFGMYTRSFAKDEIVFEEQLVALTPDGNELEIRPQGAGVMVDEIWQVARPLIDGGEPALRSFLEDWRKRFPKVVACGLQVQARRARLTSAGPVAIAPLVLAHYREASDG